MLRANFGQDGGVPARRGRAGPSLQGAGRLIQTWRPGTGGRSKKRAVSSRWVSFHLSKPRGWMWGAVDAVLEDRQAVVPPGPGQPDGGGGHPLLRREAAAAEQEALPLLRGVGGGRGGLGGAALPPASGRRTAPLSAFFGLGCYPYRNAMQIPGECDIIGDTRRMIQWIESYS